MLKIEEVDVYYGEARVLSDIFIEIRDQELVSLVGANGSGKSTLLKTISGLLSPRKGEIWFNEKRIDCHPPNQIVEAGISQVPEGRHIFEKLSVEDNLELGSYSLKVDERVMKERRDWVLELFPILEERQNQKAGTLSGGEQQMLAIGRSLMSQPKLLMLDEPSLGLMPIFVDKVLSTLNTIQQEGMTIFLVEQNVKRALEQADRGYILQNGSIRKEGPGDELLDSDLVREAYLGI